MNQNLNSPQGNTNEINTWYNNSYYSPYNNYSLTSNGSTYNNSTIESDTSYYDSNSTSNSNGSFIDSSNYNSSFSSNTNYNNQSSPSYYGSNYYSPNYQYYNSYYYPSQYYTQYCSYPESNSFYYPETSNKQESPEKCEATESKSTRKSLNKEFDKKILPLLITSDEGKSRARTAFSTEQRHYLLSIFETTSYPSKEILETAAKKLHTTTLVIQTWFKNTRSKQKKLTNKKLSNN